jgi:hypothetical protein
MPTGLLNEVNGRHLFVEVIMLRVFVSATTLLVLILAAPAGDQRASNAKDFAKDTEQLNGSWKSPKTQFGLGVTGNYLLTFEFKKDSTFGQTSVSGFPSKSGVNVQPGPSWTAELKEKDKKRFIILAETKDGKRAEVGEIAYEVSGDKLKLTSKKTVQFEKGGNPIEMSGEWERHKADNK